MLGRIDPASFLDGRLQLDPGRAREALAALGCAGRARRRRRRRAVVEVANEGMAGTIRRVAVERGVDPRDFELVAFGGAGPLHAAEIAASLGMAGVIVPPHPGLASAFGTLLADRRVDRRSTHYARSDAVDVRALAERLETMELEARAALAEEGFADEPAVARSLSMRYAGQNHELETPLAPGPLDERGLADTLAAFHALHHDVYGYSGHGETVELIDASVAAIGPGARPSPASLPEGELPPPRALREVCFAGRVELPTPVFRRERPARGSGDPRPGGRRGARLDDARAPGPGAARAPRRDPAARRRHAAPARGARSTASPSAWSATSSYRSRRRWART